MTTETTENTKTPKKERISRVIELNDGTKADFGVRNNLLSPVDLTTNTIFFKLASGEVITWNPLDKPHYTDVSALSETARTPFIYGLLQKVRANTASFKLSEVVEVKDENGNVVSSKTVNSLYDAIISNIESIDSGKFSLRGGSADEEFVLTLDQKAYALAYITVPEAFMPQGTIPWTKENMETPEVIADIQAAWEAKDRSSKNAIRKNYCFEFERSRLTREAIESGRVSLKTAPLV